VIDGKFRDERLNAADSRGVKKPLFDEFEDFLRYPYPNEELFDCWLFCFDS